MLLAIIFTIVVIGALANSLTPSVGSINSHAYNNRHNDASAARDDHFG